MAGLLGRPRKPPEERRDLYVRVRLTRDEHALLWRAAKAKKMQLSTWARRGLLQLSERELR